MEAVRLVLGLLLILSDKKTTGLQQAAMFGYCFAVLQPMQTIVIPYELVKLPAYGEPFVQFKYFIKS